MIANLRLLKDSDKNVGRKINKLLLLAPWFLKANVGRYIRSNPDLVQDLLCAAQDRVDLNEKQFLGVAFASMMAGGRSFEKLPALLKNHQAKKFKVSVDLLKVLITKSLAEKYFL